MSTGQVPAMVSALRGEGCRLISWARRADRASRCRSISENDVETGLELADTRLLHRGEGDDDRGSLPRIADAHKNAVPRVPRLAADVALGGEPVPPLHLDGEVDMRRASRVGDRFDGAEVVLAGRTREKAPEPLEVGIARAAVCAVGAAAVDVRPFAIHLPDLHDRVPDRMPARVENAAAEVRDLAHGRGDMVVDDDQVVIRIERKPIRIERSLRLPRCAHELLGESRAAREQENAGGASSEEAATAVGQTVMARRGVESLHGTILSEQVLLDNDRRAYPEVTMYPVFRWKSGEEIARS